MTKATPSTSASTSVPVKVARSTRVKKETTVVESTVTPVVESTVTPEVESTVTPEVETTTPEVETLRTRFERLIKSKQDLVNDIKREIQDLRKMQRDHEHAVKDASKRSKRKKVVRDENNPRKPSGFASPVVVSDELYEFLSKYGVKQGEPVARTDVTRYITSYIKEHDLQNPSHRREIVPDATLKKIFGPPTELQDPSNPDSPLVMTYLKLQKYISQHFPKKATV